MTDVSHDPKGRHWGLILFLILIVLPAAGFALWTRITLNYSYSHGDRAAYVQKISQKGWLCKTWEGELSMANLPGTMPQIFTFSVRDDKVARQLTETIGRRVSIHYEQHRGLPTSCFGETEYFITSLTPGEETGTAGQAAPVAAAAPALPH
jgi:hypothetical protein